ncbi:hypothetical protein [Marasmitruncus massiliensis]|uniref:hypothetical protein n=1 Tax=Marasmitruncus massiliensis TaxID=1944642 RepID=UPI000C7BC91E|nr:hypothetical protein [Marasmitruncus massiliensis]
MTAKEVYSAALTLLLETEQTAGDYDNFAIPFLNILLPETFKTNNLLREIREKEPLTEIPKVENLTDDIPYEPELLRTAIPYGLAAKLVYDDNDMSKVSYFSSMYESAVNSFSEMLPQEVEDVYA